jgi:tetratricopeptide (TPR) repeat protein
MSLLLNLAMLALDPTAQATDQPVSQSQTATLAPTEAKKEDDRIDRAAQLMKDGKIADAITILDGMIAEFEKAHPANSDSMVFSASNLMQTIYYSGITATLKKNGVVVEDDWALAYFLKGFALIDLNRPDDALPYLDKAVALSPVDSQYLAERGEWHKSRKQWDQAFADFKAAADASDFSEDSIKAHHKARGLRGMGYVRIEQGQLDEAEKLFRQSLKSEPGNEIALSELEYIKSLRSK